MHKTTLTKPGPMVDGRTLMPGTVLVTKTPPPASWKRFGDQGNEAPQHFVTNPAPQAEKVSSDDVKLNELRADYEELAGESPDKRWGEKRLTEELQRLAAE